MKMKFFCGILLMLSLRLIAGPPETGLSDTEVLKPDADSKDYVAKPGEASAAFIFIVTNTSKSQVSINALHTSCGCTVAQLPNTPYTLPSGSNVAISVAMDLRGRS